MKQPQKAKAAVERRGLRKLEFEFGERTNALHHN
jgi:hypothetical protein